MAHWSRKRRLASHIRRVVQIETLEVRQLLTTFTVNSTADYGDANPGDGSAVAWDGSVTLRAAIEEANALETSDRIEFDLPESDAGFVDIDGNSSSAGADSEPDVFVITLHTNLPSINDIYGNLVIDGHSQTQATGDTNPHGAEIVLTPSRLPTPHRVNLKTGIPSRANFGNMPPGSVVTGRVVGVAFDDGGAFEFGIRDRQVFLDENGNQEFDQANEQGAPTDANGNYAIVDVPVGSYDARVVTTPREFIADPEDGFHAIEISSTDHVETGIDFTIDQRPIIEADACDSSAQGLTVEGRKWIDLNGDGEPDDNEPLGIGWTIFADLNEDGILDNDEPSAVTGTDGQYCLEMLTERSVLIREQQQTGWTQTFPTEDVTGVHIRSENNEVHGLTVDGFDRGVVIDGRENLIQLNTIIRNTSDGILIRGNGNRILNNQIGIAASTGFGNGSNGIEIQSSDNKIGGVEQGEGNTIAFNGGNGVLVLAGSEGVNKSNSIRGNAIFSNALLSIDLSESNTADGPTTNDPNDDDIGANDLQNTPEITQVLVGEQTEVSGTISGPVGATIELEVFAFNVNDPASVRLLGTRVVNLGESSTAPFNLRFDEQLTLQDAVTATATNEDGSTSEFSPVAFPQLAAALRGRVLDDVLGDGIDPLDVGIGDRQVILVDSAGILPLQSTTTTEDGSFEFLDLVPGSYQVQVPLESDILTTEGSPDGSVPVTLDEGDAIANVDFGLFGPITIGGSVLNDLGNGATEPMPNVAVELILDDGNGELDPNDTLLASANTTDDGAFAFDELGPGMYYVRQIVPEGFFATAESMVSVQAMSRQDNVGISFTNSQLGSLSGNVFDDLLGDGFDTLDLALSDRQIALIDSAGTSPTQTAFTRDDGSFEFFDVLPGIYTVQVLLETDILTTEGSADGSVQVTLREGDNLTDIDFGLFGPITIDGRVLNDLGNGSTAPIPDVTVELFLDDGNGEFDPNDSLLASETTASNGTFRFGTLGPGLYFVNQIVAPGFIADSQSTVSVHAVSRQDVTDITFTNLQLGSVAGTVWDDLLGDGIDSTDLAISNRQLVLVESTGMQSSQTVTTALDGTFEFSELLPGSYEVQVSLETDILTTEGSADGAVQITVAPGANLTNIDFGLFGPITIGGLVANDLGDGSSEPMSNVTVELILDDGNGGLDPSDELLSSAITTNDGEFQFDALGPGLYFVNQIVPEGFIANAPSTFSVRAVSREDVTDISFTNLQLGSISGTVWNDANRNRVFDGDEQTSNFWDVTLLTEENGIETVVATTTTDADGLYRFQNIFPGSYRIQQQLQRGWEPTFPHERFSTSTAIDAGVITRFVASAHLNNDNLEDLVIVNDFVDPVSRKSTIEVLMADVNGGSQAQTIPVAARPQHVSLVDYDGDSELDLIVTSLGTADSKANGTNGVFVLRNSADGFLLPPLQLVAGGSPMRTAAADFDGDGAIDLAVADLDTDKIAVYLQQGNGTLQLVSEITVGQEVTALHPIANGDSYDLIVASHRENSILRLHGNKDGLFSESTLIANVARPMSTDPVDIDNDGNLDLVVTSFRDDYVQILFGFGDGQFEVPIKLTTGRRPTAALADDVNQDGFADILVAESGDSAVSIYYGGPDRQFAPPFKVIAANTIELPSSPQSIATWRAGQNESPEIVVANYFSGIATMPSQLPVHEVQIEYGSLLEGINFGNIIIGSHASEDADAQGVAIPEQENELDVNRDGIVSPLDALLVINRLNTPAKSTDMRLKNSPHIDLKLDINGDGRLSPIDALKIINFLNNRITAKHQLRGEGESDNAFAIHSSATNSDDATNQQSDQNTDQKLNGEPPLGDRPQVIDSQFTDLLFHRDDELAAITDVRGIRSTIEQLAKDR